MKKLWKRRRVFKRLADQAKYERTRRFYAQEVYRCDEDIARKLLTIVITVNILVLVTIFSGCNAVSGLGKDITNISEAMRTK